MRLVVSQAVGRGRGEREVRKVAKVSVTNSNFVENVCLKCLLRWCNRRQLCLSWWVFYCVKLIWKLAKTFSGFRNASKGLAWCKWKGCTRFSRLGTLLTNLRSSEMTVGGITDTSKWRRKFSVPRRRNATHLQIRPEVTHKKVPHTIALQSIVTLKVKNVQQARRKSLWN